MKKMTAKTCPTCGKEFDPADRASPTAAPGAVAQIKYCSYECKRNRNNKVNYARHKETIIEKVIERRRRIK